MQSLEALTREAADLANGHPVPNGGGSRRLAVSEANPSTSAVDEVARQMQICNACRYCETFCAVFPAMTRRLAFNADDVHYLANLCHNCGACLHACQYEPPHEFAVNIPKAMAEVRRETYAEYAWPRALGSLYRHNGLTLALATAGGLALFLILVLALKGSLTTAPLAGNFYAIFPHNLLVTIFGLAFGWAILAFIVGATKFWRGQSPGPVSGPAAAEATKNALTLTYLDGGHGDGCNEESDRFTLARRRFHHFTFYGFLLCFAATCVGTVYHYLGFEAPYPFVSLPVLLGTVGGIGLLVGPAGLLWLNVRRHPLHGDAKQRPMDRAFIVLLFATSLTGLALLAWRDTGAMALLLAVHLGAVLALFLTLPYGKFAHAVYRVAALLKFSIEKRMPSRLQLGAD
jgi:citrate/tricarballylate utilization protein